MKLLLPFLLLLTGCSHIKPLGEASAAAVPMRAIDQSDEPATRYMFDHTPLETVLDLYGELAGRSILLDPRVEQVNFSQSNEVKSTNQQVMDDIEAMLRGKGIGISPHPDRLAIVHPFGKLPALPDASRFMKTAAETDAVELSIALQMTDLNTAAQLYMQITQRPLLLPMPPPKDRFTFKSREKLTRAHAAHALESLFVINGFTMKEQGEFIALYKPGASDPATYRPAVRPSTKGNFRPRSVPAPPGAVPSGQMVEKHLIEYQKQVLRKGLPLLPLGVEKNMKADKTFQPVPKPQNNIELPPIEGFEE